MMSSYAMASIFVVSLRCSGILFAAAGVCSNVAMHYHYLFKLNIKLKTLIKISDIHHICPQPPDALLLFSQPQCVQN